MHVLVLLPRSSISVAGTDRQAEVFTVASCYLPVPFRRFYFRLTMKLIPQIEDKHKEWRGRYADRKRIIVTDEDSCSKALNKLDRALTAGTPGFGFDTETDTVDRTQTIPVTAQISYANTDILFGPDYVRRLKPWVDECPTMYGFEAKFELWAMENAGMPWKGPALDAQIPDYLINENIKQYGLKKRCATISGLPERPDWKELFGKRKSSEIWQSSDKELFIDYALADSVDHLWFNENRAEELRKLPLRDDGTNMYDDFYLKSEVPLTHTLYEMERVGALIDEEYLGELHEIAQTTMEEIQRKFYREIDYESLPKKDKKAIKGDFSGFSEKLMNSPKQLVRLFYNVLGYPAQYHMVKDKKTGKKERKITTGDDALSALAAEGYTAAALLQDNREIAKLDGTYLVGMVSHADFLHYVHTNFMQAFTATGRLSSREPALQNIPRPDSAEGAPDYMRNIRLGIRGAFVAPPGFVICGGDYGQIETRLMAHLSGDKDMIRACMESDIYSAMAAILFHKPKEYFAKTIDGWVNKEAGRIRQIVKAIVLGIGFGKQAKSIARDLKITEKEADSFLKKYFLRFPVFYAWMRKQIRLARQQGFARTITGRYRRLPDLKLPSTKDNWWKISTAERQALNFPCQGGAWEIMKKTLLNLRSSGLLEQYGTKMFLTVHDELLCYCPIEHADEFSPKLRELMMHPFAQDFKVPLEVALFTRGKGERKRYGVMDWASAK